jgi:hypothetical protein
VSDQADSLVTRLAPYRETPGIVAALLISHDGFVVAADAEPGFAADAVAAQVAGAIDMGARLAGELGQPEAKYISLEFDTLNVVPAHPARRLPAPAGAARGAGRTCDRRDLSWKMRSNNWTNWRGTSASAPAARSSSPAVSAPSPEAVTRTAR